METPKISEKISGFYKNTDTTISLSRDTTVNLMDNLDFRVADSDTLRFMPVAEVTWPGNETRGTIWSESPIAGRYERWQN